MLSTSCWIQVAGEQEHLPSVFPLRTAPVKLNCAFGDLVKIEQDYSVVLHLTSPN